jgi:hypothetical protein
LWNFNKQLTLFTASKDPLPPSIESIIHKTLVTLTSLFLQSRDVVLKGRGSMFRCRVIRGTMNMRMRYGRYKCCTFRLQCSPFQTRTKTNGTLFEEMDSWGILLPSPQLHCPQLRLKGPDEEAAINTAAQVILFPEYQELEYTATSLYRIKSLGLQGTKLNLILLILQTTTMIAASIVHVVIPEPNVWLPLHRTCKKIEYYNLRSSLY